MEPYVTSHKLNFPFFAIFAYLIASESFKDANGFEYNVIAGTNNVVLSKGVCCTTSDDLIISSEVTASKGGNKYTVTEIGESAFYLCSGYEGNLKLPATVNKIGNYAFQYCGFKGELNLPQSLTYIGNYSFMNCKGFTGALTIPNSVMLIGSDAFATCIGLNGKLTLSDSLVEIGDNAFAGCLELTGNVVLPSSLERIGMFAFASCLKMNGILAIPQNIVNVSYASFAWSKISQLNLSCDTERIGEKAFYSSSSLSGSIIIPKKVSQISSKAFAECAAINEISYCGEEVPEVETNAFEGASKIQKINVIEKYNGTDFGGMPINRVSSMNGQCPECIKPYSPTVLNTKDIPIQDVSINVKPNDQEGGKDDKGLKPGVIVAIVIVVIVIIAVIIIGIVIYTRHGNRSKSNETITMAI